ncbi:hypothetical protein Pmani_028248 [Petrolisthes manimaculis]|uniref:WWE domain-containing protein n=1 Tax=Petrolisthes manimaculis TaxID=1843537 RepID=A0AAE1TVN3_9EUCA|nr:hypothetical protein Pmani_028248 [Petrolisthes manimaculis]
MAKMNSKHQKTPKELLQRLESPHGRAYVPIICVPGLDENCGKTDCRMYHSKQPWSWQYRKDPKHWGNLSIRQIKTIETAYRDVTLEEVEISSSGVLGNGTFKVSFTKMKMYNTDGTKTHDIRRLSTKSSVESKTDRATTFIWFLNYEESEEWEIIDDYSLVEGKYLPSQNTFITFQHNNSTFQLSLFKMEAKNQDTGEKVRVRRRPEGMNRKRNRTPQHKEQQVARKKNNPMFNQISSLDTNTYKGLLQLTDLPSEEELQVKMRLLSTFPQARDVKVLKVQNQELFRSFNTKMTELQKRTQQKPWVHRLFHCPIPDQVDTICRENFSPNLQMTNITQTCGKGTYFFIRAGIADRYCCGNEEGVRVLMMADVFLGDVTKGDWSLAGPPKKPFKGVVYSPCVADLMRNRKGDKNMDIVRNDIQNDAPQEDDDEGCILLQETSVKVTGQNSGEVFDTVVDDIKCPETFVKYSKRDFYPRYIITYSKK